MTSRCVILLNTCGVILENKPERRSQILGQESLVRRLRFQLKIFFIIMDLDQISSLMELPKIRNMKYRIASIESEFENEIKGKIKIFLGYINKKEQLISFE